MLRSIADALGVNIGIPDHTTLSRRGGGLTILPNRVDRNEQLHLLVDSTGVKIYGEGEWLYQKHGTRTRRRWRKLHLGVDPGTHEIVAVELTPDDVGDVSEMPELLDQIDAAVASLAADGAYDGEAVYDAVAERHPEASVIIPKFALARAISPSGSAAKCLRAVADCVHKGGLAPARPNVIRFADAYRCRPRTVALRDPDSAVRLPADPISSNTAVPNLL